jgi:hypothetical protein
LGRSLDQGLTLAALERALVIGTPEMHHSYASGESRWW